MHDVGCDWVADVFRQWDCYEQEWVQDAPLLVRFEGSDALIAADEVLAAEACVSESVRAQQHGHERCLCWRRDAALDALIGRHLSPDEVRRFLFGR